MNFSLYACKQFLKDYNGDDYDVSFTPENIDVIASEMSVTNTQFTYPKVRALIQKLKNEGRLDKPQENKMEQTQEELLVELTLNALHHWIGEGKKPANLLATENNSFVITGTISKYIQQTGRKPNVQEVDKIVKSLDDIHTGGLLQYAQILDRQPSPQQTADS